MSYSITSMAVAKNINAVRFTSDGSRVNTHCALYYIQIIFTKTKIYYVTIMMVVNAMNMNESVLFLYFIWFKLIIYRISNNLLKYVMKLKSDTCISLFHIIFDWCLSCSILNYKYIFI